MPCTLKVPLFNFKPAIRAQTEAAKTFEAMASLIIQTDIMLGMKLPSAVRESFYFLK